LWKLPFASCLSSAALRYVPANHEPIITVPAPAASANATSRGCRTPPSAVMLLPRFLASAAQSSTAENCGRPTPVIMRVVHIAPGPTPTFTMSTPALIRSAVPSRVTTLPAITGTFGASARTASTASSILRWCPCAASTTSRSTPNSSSAFARPTTSPLMPTAAPTTSLPFASMAGS